MRKGRWRWALLLVPALGAAALLPPPPRDEYAELDRIGVRVDQGAIREDLVAASASPTVRARVPESLRSLAESKRWEYVRTGVAGGASPSPSRRHA